MQTNIWYDPKTLKILKRNMHLSPETLDAIANPWRRHMPVPDENGMVRFNFGDGGTII